jgi:hypothetical protein
MISAARFYLAKSIGNKTLNRPMPDASIFIGTFFHSISGSTPGEKQSSWIPVIGSVVVGG